MKSNQLTTKNDHRQHHAPMVKVIFKMKINHNSQVILDIEQAVEWLKVKMKATTTRIVCHNHPSCFQWLKDNSDEKQTTRARAFGKLLCLL